MDLKIYSDPLTFEKIKEVIQDQKHISNKVKFYFAVDPNELFDFCFPIDPFREKNKPLDKIADDQVALYHIFFSSASKPILLKEYKSEIQGIIEYIEIAARHAREVVKKIRDLLSPKNNVELLSLLKDQNNESIDLLKKNFNLILAVAMDIFSDGIARLKRIYNKRLAIDTLDLMVKDNKEKSIVEEIYHKYQQTELVKIILKEITPILVADLQKQLSNKLFSKAEVEEKISIKLNNTFTDVLALDRIFYLNSALEKAHKNGNLSDRHIVLYLSSAPKTKMFFDVWAVKERMLYVEHKAMQIWRTRDQIFTYLVNRGSNQSKVIDNLEKVSELLNDIEAFSESFNYCSECLLYDKQPKEDCAKKRVCNEIKAQIVSINANRSEIYNLGLIGNLQEYKQLAKELESKKESDFITYFKGLYDNNENLSIKALEKKEELEWLILAKLKFTNILPERFRIEQQRQQAGISTIVTSRTSVPSDVMYGVAYVPLLSKVKAICYKEIIEAIYKYYQLPDKTEWSFIALEKFLKQDAEMSKINLEHELFRTLLYLILPAFERHRLEASKLKEQSESYYEKCYK